MSKTTTAISFSDHDELRRALGLKAFGSEPTFQDDNRPQMILTDSGITDGSETALDQQVGGKHYKHLAIQPAEYCQKNRLPYCESSVIRYVTRHREKNGRQDLEKAIHCLQLLIEMEYPESTSHSA